MLKVVVVEDEELVRKGIVLAVDWASVGCAVVGEAANGQEGLEVIARYRGYTHLRCRLETGRTHQIRVHLAWRSHPIVGDMIYGHKKPELGLNSQCLHAAALDFIHPRTGKPVHVECELPDYFTQALSKLEPL